MEKTKILLEYNEKAFQDLIKKQDAAAVSLKALVNYCQETLQIKVTDLKEFFKNPRQYCIDAYWNKYGEQYKNSPVHKEKLLTLTAWNDAKADSYIREAQTSFSFVGKNNYEITATDVTFKRDSEEFKTYVREEDEALYHQLTEFIAMAKEIENKGGKPAWTLHKFHPALAAPVEELIHSKTYFLTSEKHRNVGLARFM